jgi:hypothetical protein
MNNNQRQLNKQNNTNTYTYTLIYLYSVNPVNPVKKYFLENFPCKSNNP